MTLLATDSINIMAPNVITDAMITSTNITPVMGSTARRSAPSGAATMMVPPCSIWLSPATRASCSGGTISDVEA